MKKITIDIAILLVSFLIVSSIQLTTIQSKIINDNQVGQLVLQSLQLRN